MAQNCEVSGPSEARGAGAQILAVTLNLFQSGGRLCPPHIPLPPEISDVPTALSTHAVP